MSYPHAYLPPTFTLAHQMAPRGRQYSPESIAAIANLAVAFDLLFSDTIEATRRRIDLRAADVPPGMHKRGWEAALRSLSEYDGGAPWSIHVWSLRLIAGTLLVFERAMTGLPHPEPWQVERARREATAAYLRWAEVHGGGYDAVRRERAVNRYLAERSRT